MSSRSPAKESSIWQHPYVSVFNLKPKPEMKLEGDVQAVMDKRIGKRVYRIRGSVAAANYVQVPESRSDPGLGLTGRFIYIQLRGVAGKLATFHLDVVTKEGHSLRISFSSIFRSSRYLSNVLRLPISISDKWTVLAIDAPAILQRYTEGAFSAESYSSLRGFVMGSSMYLRGVYTSDKVYSAESLPKDIALPIQSTAGWFHDYDWVPFPAPRDENDSPSAHNNTAGVAVEAGAPSASSASGPPRSSTVARKAFSSSPAARAAPLPERRHYSPQSVLSISMGMGRPAEGTGAGAGAGTGTGGLLSTASSSALARAARVLERQGKTGGSLCSVLTPSKSSSRSSPSPDQRFNNSGQRLGGRNLFTSALPARQSQSARRGKSQRQHAQARPVSAIGARRSGSGNVSGNTSVSTAAIDALSPTGAKREQDRVIEAERRSTLGEADEILARAGILDPSAAAPAASASISASMSMSMGGAGQDEDMARLQRDIVQMTMAQASRLPPSQQSILTPDPIIQLERVVGYSGGSSGKDLLWSADSCNIVFSSQNIIVILDTTSCSRAPQEKATAGAAAEVSPMVAAAAAAVGGSNGGGMAMARGPLCQRFLVGHTAPVHVLAFNSDSSLLASAQEGKSPAIKIWRFSAGDTSPLCGITGHEGGLHALTFSDDNRLLCGVGLDKRSRVQLLVWDISGACDAGGTVGGAAPPKHPIMVARQISDFDISQIKFSPYEPRQLVSCGRENVRFWRIHNGHLPGRAAVLHQYARGARFHDFDFEGVYGPRPAAMSRVQRHVFVASDGGLVLQVEYDSLELKGVYRLHDGSINCIKVNEGFCVTGSADKFLRVWPLDFADYFLEAQHEGSVSAVDVSPDGLKIIVGTHSRSVGLLDVATHEYQTLMRSHVESVHSFALRPHSAYVDKGGEVCAIPEEEELTTVSSDGTIRVWAVHSCEQKYQFDAPGEVSRCVAYHPSPSTHVVACGFDGGCVRVFDVPSTSMVHEYRQHRAAVLDLKFSPDGTRMYTAAADGFLCMYDVGRDYQPVKMISGDMPGASVRMAVSASGARLAVVGLDATHLLLLRADTLQQEGRVQLHRADAQYSRVCFSPSDEELVALTTQSRLIRYHAATGRLIKETPPICPKEVGALAVSPNGMYIATGGDDGVLRVWDYKMRGPKLAAFQKFEAHGSGIKTLEFTADGRHLVSVGADDEILVWHFLGDSSGSIVLVPAGSIGGDGSGSRSGAQDKEEEEKEQEEAQEDGTEVVTATSSTTTATAAAVEHPSFSAEAAARAKIAELEAALEQSQEELSASARREHEYKAKLLTMPLLVESKGKAEAQQGDEGEEDEDGWVAVEAEGEAENGGDDDGAGVGAGANPLVLAGKHYSSYSGGCPVQTSMQSSAGVAHRVLGYTGGVPRNLIWDPPSGLLAYSVGTVVVADDVESGAQTQLVRHRTEVSALAYCAATATLASASGCCEGQEQGPGQELGPIHLWGMQGGSKGAPACTLLAPTIATQATQALSFREDGQVLVSVGVGGSDGGNESEMVVWATPSYGEGEGDEAGAGAASGSQGAGILSVGAFDGAAYDVLCLPSSCAQLQQHGSGAGAACGVQFVVAGQKQVTVYGLRQGDDGGLASFGLYSPTMLSYVMGLGATALAYAPSINANNTNISNNPDTGGSAMGGMGGVLAVGHRCGSVRIWDLAARALLVEWQAMGAEVRALQWCAGGRSATKLAVGGEEDKLQMWELEEAGAAPELCCVLKGDGSTSAMVWDAQGTEAVFGTVAGTLWYAKANDGDAVRLGGGHASEVKVVAFNTDGSLLVSGGEDGSLRVWDAVTANQVVQFEQKSGFACECVAFAPCPSAKSMPCAAGYADGSVRVFELATMTACGRFAPGSGGAVTSLLYIQSSLISGLGTGTIHTTDLSALKLSALQKVDASAATKMLRPQGGAEAGAGAAVVCLEASPLDAALWLAVDASGSLAVYKHAQGVHELVMHIPASAAASTSASTVACCRTAAFSPAQPGVVLHVTERAVSFWDVAAAALVPMRVLDLDAPCAHMRVSARGPRTQLVTVTPEGVLTAATFDSDLSDAGEMRWVQFGHGDAVNGVCVSPSGSFVVSCGWQKIVMWQPPC